MKINWKVRFKNKVWLASFISLIVGFIYNLLRALDIVPTISQQLVMDIIGQILTILGMFGLVQDPTTAGLGDSQRAMSYDEPWDDSKPHDDPNAQAET